MVKIHFLIVAIIFLVSCGLPQQQVQGTLEKAGGAIAEITAEGPTQTTQPTSTTEPSPTTDTSPTASDTATMLPSPSASPPVSPSASPTALTSEPGTPKQNAVNVFIDGEGGDVFTGEDNLLNSHPQTLTRNLGTHANLELSLIQNVIMRFDLSSLSSSDTIHEATLHLYKSYPQGEGGGTVAVTVYSLTRANRSWVEGVQSIDPALTGESCWNELAYGVTPWAGRPGASQAGVDYETNPMGSLSWTPLDDAIGTEYVIQLNPARVKGWLGANNTNYGILITTAYGGSDHVGSAESLTPAYRPKLVVRYSSGTTTIGLDQRQYMTFITAPAD